MPLFAVALGPMVTAGQPIFAVVGEKAPSTAVATTQPASETVPTTEPAPATQPAQAEPSEPATTQPAKAGKAQTTQTVSADEQKEDEREIKPRFELHVPSWRKLISDAQRSNGGFVLDFVRDVVVAADAMSSEGIDVGSAAELLAEMKGWPDTSVHFITFAPDLTGRPRWMMLVDWPVEALSNRVDAVLTSESAQTLLENTVVKSSEDVEGPGFEIALPDTTLAYLLPLGEDRSVVCSHLGLEAPDELYIGTQRTHENGKPLVVCRLNRTPTEKDTGGSFWSQIRVITAVDYGGRVDDHGDWVETFDAYWPPLVGLGAKAIVERVGQTFFVPEDAFGAFVGESPALAQLVAGASLISGENPLEPGPIAGHVDNSVCVSLLPGTGFLPIPDYVLQARAKNPDSLVEKVRKAIKRENERQREKELPTHWNETTVKARTVFWHDGASEVGGIAPAVTRTVVFVNTERDAKGKQRDFLVVGKTSTFAEDLVDRWVSYPRFGEPRYLPTERRTYGQAWIHWNKLYRWISPYVNIATSIAARDIVLPARDKVEERLSDGRATLAVKYTGLRADHRGPLPLGPLVVPLMAGASMAEDVSGGSDLARERDAARKLKVLYHHATLFHKDIGRWPAEVAELQGYVDFVGHPELLRVQSSPSRTWSRWIEKVKGAEEEEEDEAALYRDIDDSIYVVRVHNGQWRLGFEPNTFDHLKALYIDETGTIHRVERSPEDRNKENKTGTDTGDASSADQDEG